MGIKKCRGEGVGVESTGLIRQKNLMKITDPLESGSFDKINWLHR